MALEAPPPIAKQGSRWQLTAAELSEDFWARAERLTELRRYESQQMQEYVDLPFGEHMSFLIRALDGDDSEVTASALPPLPTGTDERLESEAIAFLRRSSLPIEPRARWPTGGMPRYGVTGVIGPADRAEPGKALCVWGDAGWGGLVRQGKYRDGEFADDLVAACVNMVREWDPRPAAHLGDLCSLTTAPRSGAELRTTLGCHAGSAVSHGASEERTNRPEQKTMANSTQQARNVDGSLEVDRRSDSSGAGALGR